MYFKNTESPRSFADIAPFDSLDRHHAIGLPMDQPSPDHSTFSRFSTQLSKEAMKAINHELLSQFFPPGLTINEGIAIDAGYGFVLTTSPRPPSMTVGSSTLCRRNLAYTPSDPEGFCRQGLMGKAEPVCQAFFLQPLHRDEGVGIGKRAVSHMNPG